MSAECADTNVVLYLLDNSPKADRAEVIPGAGAPDQRSGVERGAGELPPKGWSRLG
jgi:hypothetical protein